MRKSLSPAELGFQGRDRRCLSRALDQAAQVRCFRRLQAVLLVARGQGVAQAAQLTGLSLRSVYRLVARYLQSHRVADLKDRPRSGRPAAAPELTTNQILRELHRSPLKLGYRTNVWTVGTLARHLSEKYECSLGPFALRQRMKEMGLVYKRPRYFYSEKEPHQAQKKGGHRAPIAAPAAQGRVAL
jgi:transposase